MTGLNDAYLEELYFQYLRDPQSVSQEWRNYFADHRAEMTAQITEDRGAAVAAASDSLVPDTPPGPAAADNGQGAPSARPAARPNGLNRNRGAAPAQVQAQRPQANAPAKPATPAPTAPTQKAKASAPASPAKPAQPSGKPDVYVGKEDSLESLSGIAGRIATNMDDSLSIPTATSVRTLPIIVLDENRRMFNHILVKSGRRKLSYTHIVAWAIVKALIKFPQMNDAFAVVDGKAHRVQRKQINLGLAVDVQRKDGSRMLMVPCIRDAGSLDFLGFVDAYDEIVRKARTGSISPDDLMGTTVTLTNPGGIGTIASMPRLMKGQGLILATGSIDYPPEFAAVAPNVRASMAVSKVMTITSTYDHRIIQGAESGVFLQYMHKLLLGEDKFYDSLYSHYDIPFFPVRWEADNMAHGFAGQDQSHVVEKESKVLQMIHAYRVRGHLYADINPLYGPKYEYPELEPSYYGLTVWDFEREYDTGGLGGVTRAPLRDIVTSVRDIYCGKIGLEYMHIQEPAKKAWVRNRFESHYFNLQFSRETKLRVFRQLVRAEIFESFLGTKFLGQKRFSLEGAEVLISMLHTMVDKAVEHRASEMYMGMAHRGRLNVLVNLLNKSAEQVFREFEGIADPESNFHGSGDVKYHLGADGEVASSSGRPVRITLASNPSHLEAVDPVVEGMARARLDQLEDDKYRKVIPVLIHGDSAFAGQGVVSETLNLANLKGYSTGGTIHIIINNQIGFTTLPDDARSTPYASDVSKMLQVPAIHVNADDPEAVLRATIFAMDYRAEFNQDVVIDLLCYRKYGHNETDEPAFTQPVLYKKIRSLRPWSEYFAEQLVRDEVLNKEEAEEIRSSEREALNRAYEARNESTNNGNGQQPHVRPNPFEPVKTTVDADVLRDLSAKLTVSPDDFNMHRKLADMLKKRHDSVMKNEGIDWGTGETLAYASLVTEGHPVRLSGQDSARGTFTHRHAVLTDQKSEKEYLPLNNLKPGEQEKFAVYDSSLSEVAVVGFEYGYSVVCTEGLILWEGQFGDFANGAQIIFDQFISSAEEKWGQTSNVVMLLPHGYEGQGPEHSSGRMERFLQLAAEDNMVVANYTTPANYFHAVRRQVKRSFRKPLIIFTPKANLRRPISTLDDFSKHGYQEIIDDAKLASNGAKVRRVCLCSGKVYFDLLTERDKRGIEDVALVRIEQLYPLHCERLEELFDQYSDAEFCWVQEEPKNMGAWNFIQTSLLDEFPQRPRPRYIGRRAGASPATGHNIVHQREQKAIINEALA